MLLVFQRMISDLKTKTKTQQYYQQLGKLLFRQVFERTYSTNGDLLYIYALRRMQTIQIYLFE